MKFLKGLFTQHLLAKFFALVFAGSTIYLVDRELSVVWSEESLKVVPKKDAIEGEAGVPYILLTADQDVYVHADDRNKPIRLRISGSVKEREVFQRDPRVILQARSEWVDRTGSGFTERVLTEDDFRVDAGATDITILDPGISIRVDLLEEVADVPVELRVPAPIAGGLEYSPQKTRIDPPSVRVRGPRSAVTDIPVVQMKLRDLGPGETYRPNAIYQAELTEAMKKNGLTLVEGPVSVTLGVQEQDERTIRYDNVPVVWLVTDAIKKELQTGTLLVSTTLASSTQCVLELSGPAARVGQIDDEERRRILAEMHVTLDPTKLVLETGLNDQKAERLPLRVLGLPDWLRVKSIDPAEVQVEVERR